MGNNSQHIKQNRDSGNVSTNLNLLEDVNKDEVSEYLNCAQEKFNFKYSNIEVDQNSKKNYSDFVFYQCLGSGAFADVYLAKERENDEFYAVKMMKKELIISSHQEENVLQEKRILKSVEFPFIVKLIYTFQNKTNLCLVMEYMFYGELFGFLRRQKQFDEHASRFYASQVLLALEYLHYLNIAYRDLKPENILIGNDGYLKLADFGFAKIVPNRTYTLCGTPEYLAPEIIQSKGYGMSVDWWAFGVLIYELNAGYSPFVSEHTNRIYQKIVNSQYLLPKSFSHELKSLIRKLLEPDCSKRIGNLKNKIDDIKSHKWFQCKILWSEIFFKELDVPKIFLKYKEMKKFKLGSINDIEESTLDKYSQVFDNF